MSSIGTSSTARLVATLYALCIAGNVVAVPSASVDAFVMDTSGYRYDDPGATSLTAGVSISYDHIGELKYSVSAGGGSLSGGTNPNISIFTYAYNGGVWINQAYGNAGTWSEFYVGVRPGQTGPTGDTMVPVRLTYTSQWEQTFGSIGVGWNTPEPYNMAFYFDDVNWRAYGTTGMLTGTIRYGERHSIGLYTSMTSSTQNLGSPGARARSVVTASIVPEVDPDWNAAHGNAYQIFYVNAVPEPAQAVLLIAGLVILGWKGRRRRRV